MTFDLIPAKILHAYYTVHIHKIQSINRTLQSASDKIHIEPAKSKYIDIKPNRIRNIKSDLSSNIPASFYDFD